MPSYEREGGFDCAEVVCVKTKQIVLRGEREAFNHNIVCC